MSCSLESETAGAGQVITPKQVTELPLNGRKPGCKSTADFASGKPARQ